MSTFGRDLRRAARTIRANPTFAVVVVLTLGLAIGVNSAVFTVVNRCLLKPLPLADADRLYLLFESNAQQDLTRLPTSPPNFDDWRRQNTAFAAIEAFRTGNLTLTGTGVPRVVRATFSTPGHLSLIGIRPVLGRFFSAGDDRPAAPPVVILGQAFWRRRFGADRGILGRTLVLGGRPHQVIGVAPSLYEQEDEVWVPLAIDYARGARGERDLLVTGRLAPGVTPRQAQAQMSAIAARLARQYPESDAGWDVTLVPLKEQVVANLRPLLHDLLAAVAIVLLIACINIAGLQVVHLSGRRRELAIQGALGAGRRQLMSRLLAENLLLAALGGGLGLLLAALSTRLLVAVNAGRLPLLDEVPVDAVVVGYTLLLSLLAGALAAVPPVWRGSRLAAGDPLRVGGRATPPAQARLRHLLIVGEVALTFLLLVGAGLLQKSFAGLEHQDLGFDPAGTLTAKLSLPESRYAKDAAQARFYRDLLPRLAALPRVRAVAAAYPLPLGDPDVLRPLVIEGRPLPPAGAAPQTVGRAVTSGFFQAMGIPILRGRPFAATDLATSPPVVIVNRVVAERLFPGSDPLGRRISFENPRQEKATWRTIVGVAGPTRSDGPGGDVTLETYWPMPQEPSSDATLVLRLAAGPRAFPVALLRRAVAEVDAGQPLDSVATLDQIVGGKLAGQRLTLELFGGFTLLALLLAAIGVHGLTSLLGTERRPEIAVRLALGAGRRDVVRLVVARGMRPVWLGLALGLAAAVVATRWLGAQLYGVGAADPMVLAEMAAALAAMALVAAVIPARRAARVDPISILRAAGE